MLLSDKRIKEELEQGNLIIEPFEPRQLGTNSYDVRLGPYFYPEPQYDFRQLHRRGRCKLILAGAILRRGRLHQYQAWRYHPGTHGRSRGRAQRLHHLYAGALQYGRSCLSVCKCAGVGDVGYISKWTMEISNHSHATASLPVGLRVAQILFYEVGETLRQYGGKYGSWKDWSPKDMLPKLYRDYDLGHVGPNRTVRRNGVNSLVPGSR